MNENTIKITNHVKLVVKAGKLDELLQLNVLEICAASSRKEPGCEYYEIILGKDCNHSSCH